MTKPVHEDGTPLTAKERRSLRLAAQAERNKAYMARVIESLDPKKEQRR